MAICNLARMTAARLLDMAQIAERIGVQPQTVRAYHAKAEQRRRQNDVKPGDMPPPDQYYGRTPVWKQSTVDRWHRKRPGQGAGGGRPWHKERSGRAS